MKITYPYQNGWIFDPAQIQVCVKSRRIGITWASALRAVMEGIRANRPINTWYIGYNQDMAKEFIREVAKFASALQIECVKLGTTIFTDTNPDGSSRYIQGWSVEFVTGVRVVALSSSPRNLRGIKGRIVLDEAGFHDSLMELLKAAIATTMLGGYVSVISTQNGADNPFNQIVEDIESGKRRYSLHKYDLDCALKQGFLKRVFALDGKVWTPEAEALWRHNLIEDYGDAADEELFCKPAKGGGVYFPRALVQPCCSPNLHVVRLRTEHDVTFGPGSVRDQVVEQWIREYIDPVLRSLLRRPTYIGQDFGRKSDISATGVGQIDADGLLNIHLVEMRNVPFDIQKRIVHYIAKAVPKFTRAAVDATGYGTVLAESLAQEFGLSNVDLVGAARVEIEPPTTSLEEEPLSNAWVAWYARNLPRLKAEFEDQSILIPDDKDLLQDMGMFKNVNGVPRLPPVHNKALAEVGSAAYRHGDAGVAIALTQCAARWHTMGRAQFTRVGRQSDFMDQQAVKGSIW